MDGRSDFILRAIRSDDNVYILRKLFSLLFGLLVAGVKRNRESHWRKRWSQVKGERTVALARMVAVEVE